MKSPSPVRIIVVMAGLLVLISAGQAQNREKFGISAKAGGVNSVTGNVNVTTTGEPARALTDRDDLSSGDVVTTGQASQAEILLNPGTYLRLGANSELALSDDSLENLTVKLIRGSAIVEASGGDDANIRITILANQQSLAIIRGGIYRVNVQPGATDLLVRKGRVEVNNNPSAMVKGGVKVTYAAGAPVIVKLSKQDQDDFDLWSKKRAETLARANAKISGRVVDGYLASMSPFDYAFSPANRWGLWTYSPFAGCFTFVPFHYGWSSPYGHYYGSYYNVWPYSSAPGYGPTIVANPNTPGGPANGSPGGWLSGGPSSGSPTRGATAPTSSMPSQAGPRDPDSGGRSINRIKDPPR
jgi:hypothetical protein